MISTKHIDRHENIMYTTSWGMIHRENGPAVEWSNGAKRWYLNDQHYSEEGYQHEIVKRNIKKLKV